MATAKATQAAILNAKFECSVCHDVFQDPRNLPCGHTFCLQCLQNIVHAAVTRNGNATVDKIPCPQCRTQFSVGSQNLQDLPKNYTLADLISSLPANSQCDNTVYCDIHPKKEIEFYCETCQRFACSTCTIVKCKQHTVLELPDADNRFKTEFKSTLKSLKALSSNIDRAIQDITSDITRQLSHRETLLCNVDKLLSQAETKLKTLLDQLLAKLKQCKDKAKLTISKLHSEHVDKLEKSLTDRQKRAHTIQQHKATIEQHLTLTSTVFDRFKVVKQLSEMQSETSRAPTKHSLSDTSVYDMSKWQNDMTAWLYDMSGALTTATARLPQLTLQPLVTHSPALAKRQVKSAKHKRNFTLNTTNDRSVNILSVSSEGQLLVGQYWDHQLHVYSADFCHMTSITLPDNDKACDAVWTRRGNIVYSEYSRGRVVTLSQSGDVIQQTNVSRPTALSVSTDGVIYLISNNTIVYQSTDDGLTWSHMFNVTDGWECWQVIKVSTDSNTDVLWNLVEKLGEDCRLRVYTVDKRRAVGDNVTWREVTLPSHVTVDLSWYSKLTYDGHASIIVADWKNRPVHVWSVSGQYERQLVPRQQLIADPWCVTVNTRRHVMYVGLSMGTIGVFKLVYEPV